MAYHGLMYNGCYNSLNCTNDPICLPESRHERLERERKEFEKLNPRYTRREYTEIPAIKTYIIPKIELSISDPAKDNERFNLLDILKPKPIKTYNPFPYIPLSFKDDD